MKEEGSLVGDEAADSPLELPLISTKALVPPGGAPLPAASAVALFEESGLISGLLVDLAEGSLFRLQQMVNSGRKKLRLVVLVLPAPA